MNILWERSFFLLASFSFITKVNGFSASNAEDHKFCYEDPSCGPDTWEGVCQTGRRQSPIDIQIPPNIRYSRTKFHLNDCYQSKKNTFYGKNNGHTVQFAFTESYGTDKSDIRICGGALSFCYRFIQFHFHWGKSYCNGSEHTINRNRFPLELHLVHYNEKFATPGDALNATDSKAFAALGILFELSETDNPALDSVVKALKRLEIVGSTIKFNYPLQLTSFFPGQKRFARYRGSLTTPTCDQKVIWTVFTATTPISLNQLAQIHRVLNDGNKTYFNFRPLQKLNRRKVRFYEAAAF